MISYDFTILGKAADHVRSGISRRDTQMRHGIPSTVLRRFIANGPKGLGDGRRSALSIADEMHFIAFISYQ